MKKSVILNLRLMLKGKAFRFIMTGMLLLAVGAPVFYVIKYWGSYRYSLPSAETLFLINVDSVWWTYLGMLVPFLCVMPYGFCFLSEHKCGVCQYFISRSHARTYYYAQLITCFIGAALVFGLPVLINISITSCIFPVNGNDYIMGYHKYNTNWCSSVQGINFYKNTIFYGAVCKGLFIDAPILSSVFKALWSSFELGVLGVFAYALSLLIRKGAAWLMIAMCLVDRLSVVLSKVWERYDIGGVYINFQFSDYLAGGYPGYGLCYPLEVLILAGMLLVSLRIVNRRIRGDQL